MSTTHPAQGRQLLPNSILIVPAPLTHRQWTDVCESANKNNLAGRHSAPPRQFWRSNRLRYPRAAPADWGPHARHHRGRTPGESAGARSTGRRRGAPGAAPAIRPGAGAAASRPARRAASGAAGAGWAPPAAAAPGSPAGCVAACCRTAAGAVAPPPRGRRPAARFACAAGWCVQSPTRRRCRGGEKINFYSLRISNIVRLKISVY